MFRMLRSIGESLRDTNDFRCHPKRETWCSSHCSDSASAAAAFLGGGALPPA